MKEVMTKYGPLKGATHLQFYPDGSLKRCILSEENTIETPYGIFIPQYLDDDPRRKRVKPVIFHENGTVKNLPLHEQTLVETPIGSYPAELLTWHDNGMIRRLFPLDGNITGFWTEENEYELAAVYEFKFPFGTIKEKIVSLQFYEAGSLRNITFWSQDKIRIPSPIGVAEARIGVELYPDGTLKAFEPRQPIAVDTPIGTIDAYDPRAIGIHSDSLSLRFNHAGGIEAVTTSMNRVTVKDEREQIHIFKPQLRPSMFNLDAVELFPLKIRFDDSQVCFDEPDHQKTFNISACNFIVAPALLRSTGTCTSCDNCTACG